MTDTKMQACKLLVCELRVASQLKCELWPTSLEILEL